MPCLITVGFLTTCLWARNPLTKDEVHWGMIELLAVARRTYLRPERPESNPRLVKEKETDKKQLQGRVPPLYLNAGRMQAD
jgi:hypothetical protein